MKITVAIMLCLILIGMASISSGVDVRQTVGSVVDTTEIVDAEFNTYVTNRAGAGSGDMTKAVYDAGDNGVVDSTDAIPDSIVGTSLDIDRIATVRTLKADTGFVGTNVASQNIFLYFDVNGTDEALYWENASSDFRLSDGLVIDNALKVSGEAYHVTNSTDSLYLSQHAIYKKIDTTTAKINTAALADEATALAANGANASAGQAILGVDASGAAEGAFDVWTETENTNAAYQSAANVNTLIDERSKDADSLAGKYIKTYTPADGEVIKYYTTGDTLGFEPDDTVTAYRAAAHDTVDAALVDARIPNDITIDLSSASTTSVTADSALNVQDGSIDEADLFESGGPPTDNYILSYDAATGGFTWVVDATDSGDTTFSSITIEKNLQVGKLADSTGRIIIYSADNSDSIVIDVANGIVTTVANSVTNVDTVKATVFYNDKSGAYDADSILLNDYRVRAAINDSLQTNWATFIAGGGSGRTSVWSNALTDDADSTDADSVYVDGDTLRANTDFFFFGTGDGRLISRRGIFEYLTLGNEADTATADSNVVTVETLEDSLATRQMLDATLTDIADGTIDENLVNTANPWADNEVADDITASNYLPLSSNAILDADFSSNGMMARTAAGTYNSRTITGSTRITLTNGDGQAGNPTVSMTANSVDSTILILGSVLSSEIKDGEVKTADLNADAVDSTRVTDQDLSVSDLKSTTSAHWASRVTNETGTGVMVFGTSPTFTTSIIMGANTITATEFSYLDGATSSVQTQLTARGSHAGQTWTGVHDFGGATSIEIPNVANPTTDAEGEIAWDANDDALEVYSGDESESALIPMYQKIDATIFAPDGVNDQIAIFHVDALLYPFGIEIDQVSITLPADAAYSMVFEEWAGDPPVAQADIETVTTGATDSYMEDGTITNDQVDADDYIFLDIPATDVDWIHVQVIYHIIQGN